MKNTTKIIKEANKYRIMQCIGEFQPLTIEDITLRTALSRPTVMKVIKELSESGMVEKKGMSSSTGGRPAELIGIDSNSCNAIGIDFEFPKIRFLLCDSAKEIIKAKTIQFKLDDNAETVIESFMNELDSFIEESPVSGDRISGIGIGISGIINKKSGISESIERIEGWKNIDLKKMIQERFAIPVYMKNDVHFLALSELDRNLDGKYSNLIYIGIRTGIGCAIFQNNKLLDGAYGNAGFIGHTTMNPMGPRCVCGRNGCVEAYASGFALNKRYVRNVKIRTESDMVYSFADFIELSKNGDIRSKELLDEAGIYLGIMIANLIKTLEITDVCIGGCCEMEESDLLDTIEKTVQANLPSHLLDKANIMVGKLKETEYPIGACYYVLEHLLRKPSLKLEV